MLSIGRLLDVNHASSDSWTRECTLTKYPQLPFLEPVDDAAPQVERLTTKW